MRSLDFSGFAAYARDDHPETSICNPTEPHAATGYQGTPPEEEASSHEPHCRPQDACCLSGVGLTALRGLADTLCLKPAESVLIFGAGGGVGHMAVQLACRMGTRVLAVASGDDGTKLARRLGADIAVNGRSNDLLTAAGRFAPEGVDAALLTAGGENAEKVLTVVKSGGRIAFPSGVQPEPEARPGVRIQSYNGEPDADIIDRLNSLIESGPFDVHIDRTFALDKAADAHIALDDHYLGKLALTID